MHASLTSVLPSTLTTVQPSTLASTLGPAEPPPERPALRQRLLDALLGTDPKMRIAIRLGAWPAGLYLAWCVFHWVAVAWGLEDAPLGQAFIAAHALAALGFYPLVRSGYSSRFEDSALMLPQLMLAALQAALGFVLLPALRTPILQMLCMLPLVGLFGLRPHQTLMAGLGTAGLMLGTGGVLWVMALTGQWPALAMDPTHDVPPLVLAAAVALALSAVCRQHGQLRAEVHEQTHALDLANAQLRNAADTDPLTGLLKRQPMLDLLQREHKRHDRRRRVFSLAMIDIDHLRQLNDAHGLKVGDEILRTLAQALPALLRNDDVIARWSSGTLLLLLPDTPASEGLVSVERLRRQIVGLTLSPSQPQLRPTVSIGVAAHRAHDTLAHTLERAERALQVAQDGGRNRCMAASA